MDASSFLHESSVISSATKHDPETSLGSPAHGLQSQPSVRPGAAQESQEHLRGRQKQDDILRSAERSEHDVEAQSAARQRRAQRHGIMG